jgi:hypothetical protein
MKRKRAFRAATYDLILCSVFAVLVMTFVAGVCLAWQGW